MVRLACVLLVLVLVLPLGCGHLHYGIGYTPDDDDYSQDPLDRRHRDPWLMPQPLP